MIICHCTFITSQDVRSVVETMPIGDPGFRLTPGKVHAALQKRGKCCGCYPAMVKLLIEVVEELKAELEKAQNEAHQDWADNTLNHLRLIEQRRRSANYEIAKRRQTTAHREEAGALATG